MFSLVTLEAMRVLIDERGKSFEEAYSIASKKFNYEGEPIEMKIGAKNFEKDLPRHSEILYLLNKEVMEKGKPLKKINDG